ncbi:MAG: hypothetical protein ACOCZ3_00825 [Bacillota bacterium]
MITRRSVLITFTLIVGLVLSGAGMGSVESADDDTDLQVISLSRVMEETDLEFEEAWNKISKMKSSNIVELGLIQGYITGEKEDIIDFQGNDVTDRVAELAESVGDVEELEEEDYEEINTFLQEFVALEEVEDVTENVIREIE